MYGFEFSIYMKMIQCRIGYQTNSLLSLLRVQLRTSNPPNCCMIGSVQVNMCPCHSHFQFSSFTMCYIHIVSMIASSMPLLHLPHWPTLSYWKKVKIRSTTLYTNSITQANINLQQWIYRFNTNYQFHYYVDSSK